VSAREIISEIRRLPPSEQAEVIQFAYRLDAERMLSGKELGKLAQRMIDTSDPIEKLRIREELTRGFYGPSAS
jgi:predicted Zn-dependent protease